MASPIDFSGKKIGALTAIEICGSENGAVWKCLCDCGNYAKVKSRTLNKALKNSYKNTSCGCLKGNQSHEKKAAAENGKKTYLSSSPCPNGHYERYTTTSACVDCLKSKFLENRDERLKKLKEWGNKNPEKLKAAHRRWRENNRDKEREGHKRRRSTTEGKQKKAIHQRARQARIRANGGGFVASDIEVLKKNQKGLCTYCKCELAEFHIDHITPISRGGLNEKRNIQLLCPTCNLRKGNKTDLEFREAADI